MDLSVKKGDKILFVEESKPYKVRAVGDRYIICTKPYNLKHTGLYTIIDKQENVRGTENLVFCMGAETDEQCENMLERLEKGESEISRRNTVLCCIFKINGGRV